MTAFRQVNCLIT